MVLKLEHASESLGGSLKHRLLALPSDLIQQVWGRLKNLSFSLVVKVMLVLLVWGPH